MPIFNIAVIFIVLGIAYFWAGQGLFSSFIHFLCVFVAGAVAFAAWEPLTYGLLLGVRSDIAWMVGLLAPFVITLALLRVATNKFIPQNMDFDDTTNFVGGGLFGAASGMIAAGMIVISIGFLRLPPNFLGYQPVGWDRATGAVDARAGHRLWIPADLITAKVYERLSTGSLSTATPLATRLPNVHEQAGLIRVTYEDRSKTTLKREDVDVRSRYTVTADSPSELLSDSFLQSADGSPVPQRASMPDGSSPPAGSRLEGYIVQFNAGSKEKKGQVVIGPGQIRLICTTPTGAMSLGPIAFVTRASGSSLQVNRYRFDGEGVYAASVGGASQATMAFEFVVPPDAVPTDLLVKNIRLPVSNLATLGDDLTTQQRDDMARSGSLIGLQTQSVSAPVVVGDSSNTGPATVSTAQPPRGGQSSGIRESDGLGFNMNKQSRGGLELDSDNRIVGGSATIKQDSIKNSIPNLLKVNRFKVGPGLTMVEVDVSAPSRMSLLGRSMDTAEGVLPPTLIDTLGQHYEAVGFIYRDRTQTKIQFKPGEPIRGMSQLPKLSRSRSDQKLVLLFTPSAKVSIVSFGLGNKVKIKLDPPLTLRRAGASR